MFAKDIENLAASQVAMLRAVSAGETQFNAKEVVERYGLGAPRTITLNKKTLIKRDIIEVKTDSLSKSFRIFIQETHCVKQYLSQYFLMTTSLIYLTSIYVWHKGHCHAPVRAQDKGINIINDQKVVMK